MKIMAIILLCLVMFGCGTTTIDHDLISQYKKCQSLGGGSVIGVRWFLFFSGQEVLCSFATEVRDDE